MSEPSEITALKAQVARVRALCRERRALTRRIEKECVRCNRTHLDKTASLFEPFLRQLLEPTCDKVEVYRLDAHTRGVCFHVLIMKNSPYYRGVPHHHGPLPRGLRRERTSPVVHAALEGRTHVGNHGSRAGRDAASLWTR